MITRVVASIAYSASTSPREVANDREAGKGGYECRRISRSGVCSLLSRSGMNGGPSP